MGVKYRENANEPWRELEILRGPQGPQGIQGIQGERGEAGAGLAISGSVATYADLPNNLTISDAGEAYFVEADGKLYIWSGTAWPANGEGSQFKGDKGDPGKDGYTPVKGVDYFDGEDGYTPVKGKDYFDGKDGTSATHRWNGTVLEITSASGTTSADLKGEKGDTGEVDYSRLDGYLSKAVYDPQGKKQDVFAYADTKLDKAGGTMTGPIALPDGTYIQNVSGWNISTYQCPVMFNVYSLTTVGTIDINIGNQVGMHALEFSLASYGMNILLNMSGYGYITASLPTFHSPIATGICNGFVPKVRVAVDANGNRHWLLGEVDTNWGGYLRAGITKYIKMSGDHSAPNVSINFVTDETDLFTYQAEVAINNVVPYDPANLSAAVPIEKGGTGAASAADALAKLGALPLTGGTITGESGAHADTPLLLRSASTSSFLGFKNQSGTELGYLGFDANKTPTVYIGNIGKKLYHEGYKPTASDVGAPTVDEMNTAIANAIGTALEASY